VRLAGGLGNSWAWLDQTKRGGVRCVLSSHLVLLPHPSPIIADTPCIAKMPMMEKILVIHELFQP
jgi:hypothetical protein